MKLSIACACPVASLSTSTSSLESKKQMSNHRKAISGHGIVSMSLYAVDSDESGKDGYLVTAKSKNNDVTIIHYESEQLSVPSNWDRKRIVNEAWFWVHEKLGAEYEFRSDMQASE